MTETKKYSWASITAWLRKNWLPVSVALVLLYLVIIKVIAARKMPLIADEPDDLTLAGLDLKNISTFFRNSTSPDQARLPNVLAAPFIAVLKENAGMVLRYQAIVFHCVYLIGFLQLLRLKLSDKRAFVGFLLVAMSSYLFSFSYFLLTTSNSLYLMITVWLWYFYLKMVAPNPNRQPLTVTTLFGIFIGLMLASKILGLIVMVALFVYDAWLSRKQKPFTFSRFFMDTPQQWVNLSFVVAWLAVNIFLESTAAQLTIVYIMVTVFVFCTYINVTSSREKVTTGLIERWMYVTQTAFVTTLIASPIYLNGKNLLGVFGWDERWNNGMNTINPTKADVYVIVAVKLGLVVGVMLITALMVLWRRRLLKKFASDNALILIVVIMHLLAFLYIKNIITWYPLIFFPILYMPFVYLFPEKLAAKGGKRVLGFIAIGVILCIPVYEQWRYFRVFPYAHTDGTQYGTRFVGWNRPGMLTFEAMPYIIDDFKAHPDVYRSGVLRCAVVDLGGPMGEAYATEYFNYSLSENGLNTLRCARKRDSQEARAARIMITSHYSNPKLIHDAPQTYTKLKDYYINGAVGATVWAKK